jgi:hypothetical protein
MSAIFGCLCFAIVAAIGCADGYRLGREKGRRAERRQVLAFLHGGYRKTEACDPEEIAGRIAKGDHLAYDFAQRPPKLGGA